MESTNKIEKLLPYVDNLTLTAIKIQQIKQKGLIVPKELDDLYMQRQDELTEQWFNLNPSTLKINSEE